MLWARGHGEFNRLLCRLEREGDTRGERGREAVLHAQPGCPWAAGAASLGIWHETPRQSEDPASEELVGQPPTKTTLGGASLPRTSSVPEAAAASTFMPREEGSESTGLAPGLR